MERPGVGTKKIGRNPEPTGTHFLGSDSEPGTHRNPLFGLRPGTRNPLEPTFWVPTWNPEPIGTHFDPICLEPGTHRNPLWPYLPGTRNPLEPKYYRLLWVPPGTLEPGTHYEELNFTTKRQMRFNAKKNGLSAQNG